MYDLTGNLVTLNFDYETNKANITFCVNQKDSVKRCWDELRDKNISIQVDEYKEKRSLNANNYAWALLSKIGNVMRLSKEDVYLKMLKEYGQSEMISVKAHIPISDYIKYCEEAGESTLNGTVFKHYKVYKGSSEFTKSEMAIFLDGVVSQAQELDIDTRTPDEIARLKDLWGE